MKEEGVYIAKIYGNLNQLEANDKENCLIQNNKQCKLDQLLHFYFLFLDSENAGNLNDGRWTERFRALTDEERESEIQSAAKDADEVFQQLDKSLLFTFQNWHVSWFLIFI